MATTTNYTTNGVARKVDLYVMGAFKFGSNETQQLAMTIGAETGGQVCAGVVKLAQKVVNFLLSLGIPYDEAWGTVITASVLNDSAYQLQQTFPSVVTSALGITVKALRVQELDTTPADEQIDSLEMTNWSLDKYTGVLSLALKLTTVSGDVTPIVVPISIVP